MASVPLIPNEGAWDAGHPFAQVLLRCTTPDSDDFNDMQIYGAGNVPIALLDPAGAEVLGSPVIIGPGASLQKPRSTGRLTLTRTSADARIQSGIELKYFADPEDTRRMIEALRDADHPPRQYQPHLHDDRRESGRLDER